MGRTSSPGEGRCWLSDGDVVAGSYRVEHLLGEGSSGEVWAATDTATGAEVALKVLAPGAAQDPELAQRFRREAYFLARAASEHVARIHDFVCDPDVGMVLVMERVDGESLATVLERGTISVEEAIELGLDLLEGVEVLHGKRVVHRDLKPGNILMRPSAEGRARPVICDFGLSRLVPPRPEESASVPSMTALTKSDVAMGTVKYMAPEQVLNAGQATEQSDLYAIGAILCRAVTGSPPFGHLATPSEIARAKVIGEAPPIECGRTDAVGRGFDAVVTRAIRRRPADRHPDAASMRADLARLADVAHASLVEGDTTRRAPAQTVASSRPPPERRKRRSSVALAAGLVVVFAAGVATGQLWNRDNPLFERIVGAPPPWATGAVRARTAAPVTLLTPATEPLDAIEPTNLDDDVAPTASRPPPATFSTPPRRVQPEAVASLPRPAAPPRTRPGHEDDNPY